jgi:hypothetical protein
VAQVAREKYCRHAALAELALDAVAVGERGPEALNGVGQADTLAEVGVVSEWPNLVAEKCYCHE